MAARYEVDVPSFVQILFFVESPVGEVFLAAIAMDERTVTALLLIAGTLAGMMADTGARPHVVHGPHYGFARCEDILDVSQRQHPLIYPMKMNYIRLLKFRERGDVRTRIGNIDGKDIIPFEMVGFPYNDTFPDKFPYHAPVAAQ